MHLGSTAVIALPRFRVCCKNLRHLSSQKAFRQRRALITELRDTAAKVKRAAAIGGGFIGMEVAAVLAQKGVDLTMILSDDRIWKRFFKPQMASYSCLCTINSCDECDSLEVTVTV